MNNRSVILWPLLLATVSLAVYLPSLAHDFIPMYDDTQYVLCNPVIQGFSLQNITAAFSRFYCGNYAPLQMLSYMLDYTLWGMRPAGYILSNVLLHTFNGLLLYRVLKRSNLSCESAFIGSMLFLLHPVQVEAVVWVSERKTVLSMLSALAAWNFWLDSGCGGIKRYLLSVTAFCAAILTKSVAVVLPLFMLVHDAAHGGLDKSRLRLLRRFTPFFLVALVGGMVAIYSQDPSLHGGRTGYHGGSPLATLYTMLPVLFRYLGMVFYPTALTVYYGDVTIRSRLDEEVVLAAGGVLLLLALGVFLYRRNKMALCWYVLFFMGLLPVSQIIPIITLINDRYLYFPMIGVAGICAVAAEGVSEKLFMARKWLVVGSIPLFALLAWLTVQQAKSWENTYTLYRQIVRHNNTQFDPLILQDMYLLRSSDAALLELAEALLAKFPSSPEALRFTARINLRANRLDKARQALEQLIIQVPSDIESLTMLAEVYKRSGRPDESDKNRVHPPADTGKMPAGRGPTGGVQQ